MSDLPQPFLEAMAEAFRTGSAEDQIRVIARISRDIAGEVSQRAMDQAPPGGRKKIMGYSSGRGANYETSTDPVFDQFRSPLDVVIHLPDKISVIPGSVYAPGADDPRTFQRFEPEIAATSIYDATPPTLTVPAARGVWMELNWSDGVLSGPPEIALHSTDPTDTADTNYIHMADVELDGGDAKVVARYVRGPIYVNSRVVLPQLWASESDDGLMVTAGKVVHDQDTIAINSDGMGGVVATRSGLHANVVAVKDATGGTAIATTANYTAATELWLIIETDESGRVTEAFIDTATGSDVEYTLPSTTGLYSTRLCHFDTGVFVRDWGGGAFFFGAVEVENTGYTILP